MSADRDDDDDDDHIVDVSAAEELAWICALPVLVVIGCLMFAALWPVMQASRAVRWLMCAANLELAALVLASVCILAGVWLAAFFGGTL